MCFFEEKIFLLCPYEEMFPHFKLHMENSSYFVRWLPKTNPKNVETFGWYCMFISVFYTNKQSSIVKYK